jgi:BirA family biotin operon repressor/biotin-[acetyl-CoA-carboxylase] ligase
MAEIIGKRIIKLPLVDSTNNYAIKHMNAQKYPEGTIVMAKSQEHGRGQRGNAWESQPGMNLLMSVVLFPGFLPVQYQFLISKVVALAISNVIGTYCQGVKIKWPNDIYVNNQKIAGILIENSIMGVTLETSVAGIGLNVNQVKFSDDLPNPVSLAGITKVDHDIGNIFNLLVEKLDYWYLKLKCGEIDLINNSYLENLYLLNEESLFSDVNGEFTGSVCGVDEIGRLLIRDKSGFCRHYHFKEVQFNK